MDAFSFAQAYIAAAFGAVATWVMNVLNTLGAAGFVLRMFFIGVAVSTLILPLRGAAIRSASSDYVKSRKQSSSNEKEE